MSPVMRSVKNKKEVGNPTPSELLGQNCNLSDETLFLKRDYYKGFWKQKNLVSKPQWFGLQGLFTIHSYSNQLYTYTILLHSDIYKSLQNH